MTERAAPYEPERRSRRGFFFPAPILVALTLLVSFAFGIALFGILRPDPQASTGQDVAAFEQANQAPASASAPVFFPETAPSQVAVTLDRAAGYAQSANPMPIAPRVVPQSAQVATQEAPALSAEDVKPVEVAALAQIAPAAGAVLPPAKAMVGELPTLPIPNKVRVAIVIDDIGPDYKNSREAVDLPAAITLAVLPYAQRLDTLVERAKKRGHELFIHMPMEPDNTEKNDPGPDALTLGLSPDVIRERTLQALNRFNGYVGLNNHMGSRFTADSQAMKVVLGELAARDLIFLDSLTTPQSVGIEVAAALGMKFAVRDIFLDNEVDPDLIAGQLATLERLARAQGQAIAIGHPHPETIAALRTWIPQALARGVQIVPVSALTRHLGMARVSD